MYTIKGFKSINGMEGLAYNFNLCRNGKKVASVHDDGNGGPLRVYWNDITDPKEVFETSKGEQWRMTPEQHLLFKQLSEDEPIESPYIHEETFIAKLVDQYLNEKHEKQLCKKGTLVRLKGDKGNEWRLFKCKFTSMVKQELVKEFGDKIEVVLNEKYI